MEPGEYGSFVVVGSDVQELGAGAFRASRRISVIVGRPFFASAACLASSMSSSVIQSGWLMSMRQC